jgi:hypothetical protein
MTLALLLCSTAAFAALPPPDLPADPERVPRLALALAGAHPGAGPDLSFDLLGTPQAPLPPSGEERVLAQRRAMLKVHQGLGLALFTLELATTVLGQLNYLDRYGGDQTNRYKQLHAGFAYGTFSLFAANGAIALLTPKAPESLPEHFDRIDVHKIAMFTAGAGMLSQVVLGIIASQRVGRSDQRTFAQIHLGVGYGTLAAMSVGVGALVF